MSEHNDRPLLSRAAHDRAAHRRDDEQWLSSVWSRARVLLVSRRSTTPVRRADDRTELALRGPEGLDQSAAVFLGEFRDHPYFAAIDQEEGDGEDWVNLRDVGTSIDELDAGLFTSAVALAQWHHTHTHCPRCGTLTEVTKAGWTRTCPLDGSEHFPRTDPAVIMLIHDGADRCILGRQASWPEGRFSVLAGFVEAGESAEAAVAREVGEEVGVRVKDIRYVASQPWPFPASLMLGFSAELDGDAELHLNDDELAEAGWFTRGEVAEAAVWGADEAPSHTRLRALPGEVSIARQLLNRWLAGDEPAEPAGPLRAGRVR